MTLRSWYAHSWYFSPSWMPWLHQVEIAYDLRRWMVGVSFAGKLFSMVLGPICVSYQAGL